MVGMDGRVQLLHIAVTLSVYGVIKSYLCDILPSQHILYFCLLLVELAVTLDRPTQLYILTHVGLSELGQPDPQWEITFGGGFFERRQRHG